MSRYKYPFIIKDSKQNVYKFSINENNNLILEKFYENVMKTKIILRENITNFVVDIDVKDIIHIIYVDKYNNIKYSIYANELLDNTYFNIKNEDNDYRFLFLKFIIDRLYFFFITRPLNGAQCILKICIVNDNNMTVQNALTVNCSKYTCPYFIYSNSDLIYILYSKDSNEKYTLQVLDIYENKWYEHLNIITLKKASHINFIVKNNTALICYNSFENNSMELQLASLNMKDSSPRVNGQILLSSTNCTSLYPLILPFENHASILWQEGEKITYCNFIYDEIPIVKKQYIPMEEFKIYYANYRSSFYETLKHSNIIAYTISENFLYIITDFQNIVGYKPKKNLRNTSDYVPKEVPILEEISPNTESNSLVPINVDFLEIMPYLNDYIKELYSSTTNTTELLNNYVEKNKQLLYEIDYLTRLNSSYKCRIEDLKNRLIKYRNDSANVLIKYKNVISDMEIEKTSLCNILEEKNGKILSLQHITNSPEK